MALSLSSGLSGLAPPVLTGGGGGGRPGQLYSGAPVDLRERFGDESDWDEAYDYVTSLMQTGLSTLTTRSLLPVIG